MINKNELRLTTTPRVLADLKRRQKGFTLLELLVVLGIFSGLLVSVYGYISVTQKSSRISQVIQDVQIIRGAAGNWVSGRASQYNGITLTKIKVFLPGRFDASGGLGVAINPWVGSYSIAAKTGDNSVLQITVTAIPIDVGPIIAERLNAPGPVVAGYTVNTKNILVSY